MKSKLVLGTAQLGLNYGVNNQFGQPSKEQSFEILHTAYKKGIRAIDTAEAYGSSQEVIGAFHKEYLKKFDVSTKLIEKENVTNSNQVEENIIKNLKTLNVDILDGYMFHSYSSLKKTPHLLETLISCKNKGLIKKIGVSVYTNEQINDVILHFSEIDFVQAPFNLLDNQFCRKNAFEKLRINGIEVHTRSVFLQGLFFKNKETIQSKLKTLTPYLNRLDEIAKEHGSDIQTLALQYVLQKKYIDKVLIGIDTAQQLLENIGCAEKTTRIPHDKIDSIEVLEKELLNPTNWN